MGSAVVVFVVWPAWGLKSDGWVRDVMNGDVWLQEKISGVLAITIAGSLSKCERAGPERENGARHEASNALP